MRILVTGGLGHIGSSLIRRLLDNADTEHLTILDDFSTQRYASLFGLPHTGRLMVVEGSILNPEDLGRAMHGVHSVVHLAAITNAEGSFADSEKVKLVNTEGTRRVIQACRAHGVRTLVFPSTTSVYGPMDGIAREDSPPEELRPQSPYAYSKLAAEREVLNPSARGKVCGIVLRLGTIFGPSPGMRFHTAVNKFIWQAAHRQPLTIWSNALGLVRPYLALPDAIAAIEFALTRGEALAGELFNVVTLNATLDHILEAIRRHVPDLELHQTQSPLLNQVSYHVDDAKIRALGFEYHGSLEAGVSATLETLAGLLPLPYDAT